jgi:hypothetical protein
MKLDLDQIEWLNAYTEGIWNLNQKTGLVDVAGNFSCRHRGLTDFKGIKFGTITGDFSCRNNQLTSLNGSPVSVDGDFVCMYNQLTSLEGAPESVGGDFLCSYNQLSSLVGAPEKVGRDFYCGGNQLISMRGAPGKVGGGFYLENNQVSAESLIAVYKIMKKGGSPQYWKEMPEEDMILMYADNPFLTDDEKRGYEIRDRVRRISI